MIFRYFVSPDHQNSIFCVELLPKINLIYAKLVAWARRNARSDPPPISGRRAEWLDPGPSESFQSQSSKAKVLGV